MMRLKAVFEELIGLFVDDGPYTCGIVAWLAFAGLVLAQIVEDPSLRTVVFVAGLLAVLLGSVWHTAKRRKANS
jgi:hypothetical protein